MSRSRFIACLIAAAVAGAGATTARADDQATAFQQDAGHTGFATGGSLDRPPLQLRWSRSLGDSVSNPLIAQGLIFVVVTTETPAESSTVEALDAVTGDTVWSRAVQDTAALTYDRGQVFIANGGTVIAVDAATGTNAWTQQVHYVAQQAQPVARDGTLYVAAAWSGGYVYAFDEADGTLRWKAPFNDPANVAADGSLVYASSIFGGEAAALEPSDGTRGWTSEVPCLFVNTGPVADGARVIGPIGSGCNTVFDSATGASVDSEASRTVGPAVAGDTEVFVDSGGVKARSTTTGILLWQFADPGFVGPPLIVNGTVYVGAGGGLTALDLATGAVVWQRSSVPSGPFGPHDVPSIGYRGMASGQGVLAVPGGGTLAVFENASAPRAGLDVRITSGPHGPTSSSGATISFSSSSATQCRLDGGIWLPCADQATLHGLPDGPHVFEVKTTDAADGSTVGLALTAWSVDTKTPVAQIYSTPADPTSRRDAVFGVSTDDPNARIQCSLDGQAFAACRSEVLYSGLADGRHTFQVRAVDAVGNTQADPDSFAWTVDTTPPHASIDSGPEGAGNPSDAVFTFSADETSTFRCSLDGASLTACSSPYAVDGLANGSHSFRVVATDAVGNTDPSGATRSWIVGPPPDTTPPDTALDDGPPARTSSQSAVFHFSASEPSTFQCRFDTADWTVCSSGFSLGLLADGTHDFYVRAVDQAGNIDPTPASKEWVVDTVAPAVSIDTAPSSITAGDAGFSFSANEPSTFKCGIDEAPTTACTSPVSYHSLAIGSHVFEVAAVDYAGNLSKVATTSFSVTAPTTGEGPPKTTTPAQSRPVLDDATAAELVARTDAAALGRSTRAKIRRGVRVPLGSGDAGTMTVELRGPTGTVLARARATFKSAGQRNVVLRPTSAGKRALKRPGRLRVTLRVSLNGHVARAAARL